jgi:hypothetical protein
LSTVEDPEAVLSTSIDKNTIDEPRDGLFREGRLSLLVSKELGHRDEVERTHSRTVFDIGENKVDRLALGARDGNLDGALAFKANTATNTTTVAIITIRNFGEVRDGACGMIGAASVEYPVVLQGKALWSREGLIFARRRGDVTRDLVVDGDTHEV